MQDDSIASHNEISFADPTRPLPVMAGSSESAVVQPEEGNDPHKRTTAETRLLWRSDPDVPGNCVPLPTPTDPLTVGAEDWSTTGWFRARGRNSWWLH